MIEEHISKPRLMFENYPAYLVPDTNCFVDHLDGLRAIVACQAFTLIVPLIGKAVLLQIVSVYVNFPHIAGRSLILISSFLRCLHLLLDRLTNSMRWDIPSINFVNISYLNILTHPRELKCVERKSSTFV